MLKRLTLLALLSSLSFAAHAQSIEDEALNWLQAFIQVDTINPRGGPGVTLDVDIDLDVYVLAPALLWVSPWKILGAKYGAFSPKGNFRFKP